ncbi:MAG TPA: EAL domain-containing protein [Pseudomonadales bacterium]|nr:EAL domain-containing protein [Pseudomonadales bacterium]
MSPLASLLDGLDDAIEAARAGPGRSVLVILHPARMNEILVDHGYRFLATAMDRFHARIESVPLRDARYMRLGMDRHAIILGGLADPQLGLLAAQKVQRAFEVPLSVQGHELRLEPVAGIVEITAGLDAEECARRCEVALARAEHLPERGMLLEAEGIESASVTRLREEIRIGLERAEFVLHYQPKVRGRDGRPVATEGLVRWQRGERLVMPSEFIPLVENSALLMPFTHHCVNVAIRQAAHWHQRGLAMGVSVNVPPGAIISSQMVDMVDDALRIWSTPPQLVTLEVTETSIMEEPERCIETLREMRRLGVKVSMDDFGTGYSSLAYFRDLPADELKIDRAFTFGLVEEPRARMMVKGIVDLAHAFGLTVVAEGVETEEMYRILGDLGVDAMQGWLFAPALQAQDFEHWLQDRGTSAPVAMP